MMNIAIAGGGIGGLAAALAAARAGHTVQVLEREAEFEELGAGIQLAPNGFRALERLGVEEAVRARAVHVDALRLLDARSGRALTVLPLGGSYQRRFGHPYAVVQRADLHAALLQACHAHDRISLQPGTTVTGYRNLPGAVRVLTAGGRTVDADALVGADGIRSKVRAQLVGDGPPTVSGHTIHRTVVPMRDVPPDLRWNSVNLWAGPGRHFVHYPIAGGERLNLALTRDDGARDAVAGVPTGRDEVLAGFPGLHPDARRLLGLGRDWRTWVLCDRMPTGTWTDGRVCLTGDAAHPMLQYAAQGACMALEDAVALGETLTGSSPDVEARLDGFARSRRERTARVQEVSRWMGHSLYHPGGAEAEARDALLASLSPDGLMDAVEWLHAHDLGRARSDGARSRTRAVPAESRASAVPAGNR
ncbi:FAD-dependent monooxygenase [Streptomyces sp. enrichment culture]|uniref:FAD-dependent monooxygenase n=1 Tax=Streptomyces sp. enrichment culture TaxID=1795815 RepID=UPI003F55F617